MQTQHRKFYGAESALQKRELIEIGYITIIQLSLTLLSHSAIAANLGLKKCILRRLQQIVFFHENMVKLIAVQITILG